MSVPTNFNSPNGPSYGRNNNDGSKWLTTIMGIAISLLLIWGIKATFFGSKNTKTEITASDDSYDKTKSEIWGDIVNILSNRNIKTILIADYFNLDNNQDKFGRYLSEDFSALFSRRSNSFKTIERSRLNLLLEEQNLNAAGLLDSRTVSELGKIIGVEAVITGKYQIIGEYLKIWIKVIDIEKSELLFTKESKIQIQGEIKDALKIQ